MAVEVIIPDFPYSSHFYPEILEDLVQYLRTNVPELTDEDPTEPHIQLIRAMSLSYHLNSTLLDLVANESFLPTAKLRASHVALLQLIDFQLAQAVPGSADVVATLSQTFTAPQTIIPNTSQFATQESAAAQEVDYEVLADIGLTKRTDQVGTVYLFSANLNTYTDVTAEAISPTGSFSTVGIWTPQNGDALYVGHPDVMFDEIDIVMGVDAARINGVWEYFDGNLDQTNPDSATITGGTLTITLNGLLGTTDMTGTVVRIRSAVTGHFQDLVVAFIAGTNTIVTSGVDSYLGQAAPSTTATDYIVGTAWRSLPDVVDGTTLLVASGALKYTLPQSVNNDWNATPVGIGVVQATNFWIRFRIIGTTGSPTRPTITQIRIDEGKQYLLFNVVQGVSQNDNPLGSSDGTASQQFTFSAFPVIDDNNIVVTVSESGVPQVYAEVDNFLNSGAQDRHYTLLFDDDGAAIITFGDGTNGKVPPAGVNNIQAQYRTMDDIDGNVGTNTINVNKGGVSYLSNVFNPRAAAGYNIREGSTTADLARVKIAGPASLRTRMRAVSPPDVESVAQQFKATDGSKPVARALAIEESFGPKTVECVVVGPGGNLVDATELSAIEDFFNGTGAFEDEGVLVLNHQLTATNFTQTPINVDIILSGGQPQAVVTALVALLNPLALNQDGTYTWQFGSTVPLAQLYKAIMNTTPGPTNVMFNHPTTDTALTTRALPVVGSITINGVVLA